MLKGLGTLLLGAIIGALESNLFQFNFTYYIKIFKLLYHYNSTLLYIEIRNKFVYVMY